MKVVTLYRRIYANYELEQGTNYSEVFKLVMPSSLLTHSYAFASAITDVLMMKYMDTMPIGRSRCGNIWAWS